MAEYLTHPHYYIPPENTFVQYSSRDSKVIVGSCSNRDLKVLLDSPIQNQTTNKQNEV